MISSNSLRRILQVAKDSEYSIIDAVITSPYLPESLLQPRLFFIRNGSNIDLVDEIQLMPATAWIVKQQREMVYTLLAQCRWAETADERFFLQHT